MDDTQIINSLINYYRDQGLNVVGILDNPIFNQLSTATKVQVLKQHAHTLAEAGSGFTPKELKDARMGLLMRSLWGAGMGTAAAYQAHKFVSGKGGHLPTEAIAMALGGGAIMGAAGGAMSSGYALMNASSRKNTLHDAMSSLAKSPTDQAGLNAVFKVTPRASVTNVLGGMKDEISKMFVENINTRAFPNIEDGVRELAKTTIPNPPSPNVPNSPLFRM